MKILCPKCKHPLISQNNRCSCENGHSFDYAKSGYLNLYLNHTKHQHGDNKEMTIARTTFLNNGHYEFLRNQLCEIIQKIAPSVLIDLGCGEGYYTKKFPAHEKYAFDLSKESLIYASKHDETTQYILSSIFHLPLPMDCADVIITCFAPMANDEILRILKENGYFIFITPGPKHLWEMKEILYTNPYINHIKELDTNLKLIKQYRITNTFYAQQKDIQNVLLMTPYNYKTNNKSKEKLANIASLTITADFVIRIYQNSILD